MAQATTFRGLNRMERLRRSVLRGLAVPVRLPAEVEGTTFSVDGTPVWSHCERHPLTLGPEALASAFLLPALAAGRRLSGGEVDPVWLAGSAHVLAMAQEWWGWPVRQPQLRPGASGAPAGGIGLAFSLGLDSFYSCFCTESAPDLLILVAGFDIPLSLRDTLASLSRAVAEVAEAAGCDWTTVETDLRQHPLYRASSWIRCHGGALAFVGHALSGYIDTLLVSSSQDQDDLSPWGSHPALDAYWSSSRLKVEHAGAVERAEKFRRLVGHPQAGPLIRKHLRVCYRHPTRSGNCGRCAKCLYIRVCMLRFAAGLHFDCMPDDMPLAEAIAALPALPDWQAFTYRRDLLVGADDAVERALVDLIGRSGLARGGEG